MVNKEITITFNLTAAFHINVQNRLEMFLKKHVGLKVLITSIKSLSLEVKYLKYFYTHLDFYV